MGITKSIVCLWAAVIIYAEPLGGAVAPSEVSNALVTLCRNATTDPGWPPLQGGVVPSVDTAFTTRNAALTLPFAMIAIQMMAVRLGKASGLKARATGMSRQPRALGSATQLTKYSGNCGD
jgi:hypothetical protein